LYAESLSNRNKYLSLKDRSLFLPGINGRRQKSIDSVCFELYYAGLSGLLKIETEERWLFVTPTIREFQEV